MKRILTLVAIIAISFCNPALAYEVTLTPTIWYGLRAGELNAFVNPDSMLVGQVGAFQARAYYEWNMSGVWSTFQTIESATITISNIGQTVNTNIYTYPADGSVDPWADWSNDQKQNSTFMHQPLYGWDDLYSRGPLNTVDITLGVLVGKNYVFDYFGVMLYATTPQVLADVLSGAVLTVSGTPTPVPLPSAALLFGSGLVMVWGRIAWDRRRRINRSH